MEFIKTNNTKLKLWWTHVTDISFWSLVMGLHRFFIIASCLSELLWKSVKLCWVNENRTAACQYIDGRRCFTLFHVYAKRQAAITTKQDRSTIIYILTQIHKNSLSLFVSEKRRYKQPWFAAMTSGFTHIPVLSPYAYFKEPSCKEGVIWIKCF